jgi:hypothetical protein
MKIVKWSFNTSHEWDVDHPECIKPLVDENYYPFKHLTKEATAVRKGATFLKCPAHTDFLKNTFIFCAPFDITIELDIKDEGTSRIFCENITQEQFEKLIDMRFLYNVDRGINPYPIVGIDWLTTFQTDESMLLQVFPAFMHRNDFTEKATVVPGEYDISKWTRPVECVFEVRSNIEKIVIKKGDAISYFKFHSDEIVKLENQPTPWPDIHQCNEIRNRNVFRPLKERYQALVEDNKKRCPYDKQD